jgi:hypothetical protein
MYSILSSLGWFGFAAGLIYYFIRDRYGDPSLVQHYVWQTQWILLVSGSLIVIAYVSRFMSKKTGIGTQTGRCAKCRKRIDRGETYCFDHRREAIWQAQEKHRLDGSGKFNRSQKRT